MALQWSINFLLQNSKKIEENLKDNYSFIEDTEKEINSLIDIYKYDELATCLNGFNTCKIKQELNEMSLLKLRKIDTNNIYIGNFHQNQFDGEGILKISKELNRVSNKHTKKYSN